MKARDFCYWMQACFELCNVTQFDARQTELIKRHLALVFKHDIDESDPTGELQAIHDGTKPPKPNHFGANPDGTMYRC